MSNYLEIVDAVMERLRLSCHDVKRIEELSDIQDILEYSQTAPALLVYYDGDDVPTGTGSSGGQGSVHIVNQRIVVIVVVRSSVGQASQTGVRRAAGELLGSVISALSGWQPTRAHRPLVRTTAPRPDYLPGVGFVPVAFTAQRTTVACQP